MEPGWIDSLGHFGLQYFFCGSGFLISYMMLMEYDKNGSFNIRYFYLRRIFRIWPAYLFLVLLVYLLIYRYSFFDLNGMSAPFGMVKNQAFLFFVLMMPQLNEFFFTTAPYLHHTYTIGIEEQFYLVWALMMRFFRRYFLVFNLVVLVLGILLNSAHYFFFDFFQSVGFSFVNKIATYFRYSQFSTFAIGSLLAFYYRSGHKSLGLFKSKWIQVAFYLLFAVCVYYNINPDFLGNELQSVMMVFILLFASFKESSIINYSNKFWEYLGKISYGIYLFHYIGLALTLKILLYYFHFNFYQTGDYFISIGLCLLCCIGLGLVSYYTIEIYFFRLKHRFAVKR
jgi:peptidoglycan/LPS O-acetylase OafA/YrhL